MARKRKLNADLPDEALTPVVEPETAPKAAMGGMWAGSAMNMLKQRLEDASGSLHAGILAGTVVMELDPDQVQDSVGSDRVTEWAQDEDFGQLVANISRRGQTQPIRVRPQDDKWAPDPENPLETSYTFFIQSGRRRLAACRSLGIKVKAIIATEEGDQYLADLEERFHENTMRKNLNGFEELLSIGAMAGMMQDKTQAEIAEHLGIAQGDVSLGLGCVTYRKAIEDAVDITKTPKRAYRTLIPKIKRGESLYKMPPALSGELAQPYDVKGVPITAKKSGMAYAVNIRKANVKEADLETMLVELAKVVLKYQMK